MTVPVNIQTEFNRIVRNCEKQLSALMQYDVEISARRKHGKITLDEIKDMVCHHFEVPWDKITGPRRSKEISGARMSFAYLSTVYTGYTLGVIGKRINRDHTTVIHSRATIPNRIQCKDEYIYPRINPIITKLNNLLSEQEIHNESEKGRA